MRLSSSLALAALPLLAAAESPFEQYKAQFQNFLGSFGSFVPGAAKPEGAAPEAAATAKSPAKKLEVLTLGTWKDTLYGPVKEGALKPEEWWVLLSGRNNTCYGRR